MESNYREMREIAVRKAESFGHVVPEMYDHCTKCGGFYADTLSKKCLGVEYKMSKQIQPDSSEVFPRDSATHSLQAKLVTSLPVSNSGEDYV